jgi:hypothetical protein
VRGSDEKTAGSGRPDRLCNFLSNSLVAAESVRKIEIAKGRALYFCIFLSESNSVIGFQYALRTNFRHLQVTVHRRIDDGLMLRVKKPISTRANIFLAASPLPTVLRVALGKNFNSEREYCLSTRRNMRSASNSFSSSSKLLKAVIILNNVPIFIFLK